MRILGFGGNQLATAGGFDVDNSLRFNKPSSDYLNRTTGTPTNANKCTFSLWVKRCQLSSTKALMGFHSSDSNRGNFVFENDKLEVRMFDTSMQLTTNRLFRDVSAWYHIVLAVDTTQGTASNRVKLYINGVQETSFATSSYPSQNSDFGFNKSGIVFKTTQKGEQNDFFDGYISEFVMVDGQQLDPTSFGEFDEDTGIWKPIDVSGLTFGNNGFYLDFENSGSLGADVSGNGNNFTVNNLTSIDQSTDTPTNNFCTLNPLDATSSTTNIFSEGNTQMIGNNTTNRRYGSTFAVNKGKWYFEFKQGGSVSSGGACVGIFDIDATNTQSTTFFGLDSNALLIQLQSGSGNVRIYNGSFSTDNYGSSASVGDIIMVALDMDNYFMYVGQNGTFLNSGNPTSGSSGTGNINNAGGNFNYSLSGKTFMFGGGVQNSDFQQWNFGNPSFSISSGNSDGNGYGNFEYAVPSGYYALNTKNLAEYG